MVSTRASTSTKVDVSKPRQTSSPVKMTSQKRLATHAIAAQAEKQLQEEDAVNNQQLEPTVPAGGLAHLSTDPLERVRMNISLKGFEVAGPNQPGRKRKNRRSGPKRKNPPPSPQQLGSEKSAEDSPEPSPPPPKILDIDDPGYVTATTVVVSSSDDEGDFDSRGARLSKKAKVTVTVHGYLATVDQLEGHAVGIEDGVALLLPAVRVQALAEVAHAVHEAYAHQRDAEAARRLQVVAGEHPQTAGVLGEGLGYAELG